ncbi:MAG: hypothetical protein Q8Q49_01595 [bacterium]|nr:hypothetical protein [bacterium]
MIDAVQIILLLVIITLAILLLVLGIQVFFILREIRQTVMKANKVLDDTGAIARSVTGPISSVATLVQGVSTGAVVGKVVNMLLRTFMKDKEEDPDGKTK